MEQNLPEKTGKSLAEWKTLLATKNFVKHGEIMKFLKHEMSVTHGYANFITLKFRAADAASESNQEALVSKQYQGKEHLQPILKKLQAYIVTLGSDVEIAPKRASVSFRRKRQFALVQPTTKKRIDLGLKFNDRPHGDRLGQSGPFGAMCTHRVQLTELSQVDKELLNWIKEAYNEAC